LTANRGVETRTVSRRSATKTDVDKLLSDKPE